MKPRRTTCGRARSSRRNRFELGDRRVTVSLTIRHGSPRCARHRSSHAGIESRKRPDRFQLPAWLDSTPADGRRDPWRPAIVAISAFQHEVSVAIRGDASPAWRLSARRSRRLRGLRELRGECANQRPSNSQGVGIAAAITMGASDWTPKKPFDLRERLLEFACVIVRWCSCSTLRDRWRRHFRISC